MAAVAVVITSLVAIGPAGQPPAGAAATLPPGFSDTTYAGNLTEPTHMAWAPDGRLFVSGRHGAIRVISASGTLRGAPFLSLTVDHTGDRGITGIAFDPDFATNKYLYVYYTTPNPLPHNRLSRFTASGDVAVPGSEVVLLELPNLGTSALHNGGALRFLSDGTLLVSVGDNLQGALAKRMDSLFGKILRVRTDGTAPANNPFVNLAYPFSTIWAYGFRNPYTMGLRQSDDTVMINDVGPDTYEEVNLGRAGGNYGWPDAVGIANDPRWVDPVYAYHHGTGPDEGCCVVGGAFAGGGSSAFPAEYANKYFFTDYCSGWIKTLDPANGYVKADFATGIPSPVSLSFGPDGALYYATRASGTGASSIRRIAFTGADPTIASEPADVTVGAGGAATFAVVAAGPGPFSYQWRRNDVDITGANSSSYVVNQTAMTDDGATFSVVVSNTTGTVTSREALLTVVPGSAPTPTIVTPKAGKTFTAGSVISYSGTATDPEDGPLPASAFAWRIDLHHNTHVHNYLDPGSGQKSGSFTVPDHAFETDPVIWFRIYLTVTDSAGISITTQRDVFPLLGKLAVATSPANGSITLDDQPVATPTNVSTLRFLNRTVDLPNPPAGWAFDAWSDGGAQRHDVPVPASLQLTAILHRTSGALGAGSGLTGTYFDDVDLTQPVTSRLDRVVYFTWAPGRSPAPGVTGSTYSVRWTGQVQAQFTGQHTFSVRADDGVRLWVNNKLVIDRWGTLTGPTKLTSAKITLTAGQRYNIVLETRQGSTRAGQARLIWKPPTLPESVIPGSQLFP